MADRTSLSGTPSPTRPLRWRPSFGARAIRQTGAYWLVALALAAGTAGAVHRLTQRALALEASYSVGPAVAVTTVPLERGGDLGGSIEWREAPRALVPDDAVDSLAPAAKSARELSAGAIVTSQDVFVTGIANDEAAVAVPAGPTTPEVDAGADVLLILHPDPFAGSSGMQLVARVAQRSDEQVTVAVPRSRVGAVAAALAGAGVTIALL